MEKTRLQKYLATLGLCSRRQAEAWIAAGRVLVNGKVASLGDRVDPCLDRMRVDGRLISQRKPPKLYFALNKPDLTLTSRKREREDMETVFELPAVRSLPFRLNTVGRLDFRTEGLLLLTNDGELCFRLMHPSYSISRSYTVTTRVRVDPKALAELRSRGGIKIAGSFVASQIRYLKPQKLGASFGARYNITLHSGQNRIVRRIFAQLEAPVLRLVRNSYGPINLSPLAKGDLRQLSKDEIIKLKASVNLRES